MNNNLHCRHILLPKRVPNKATAEATRSLESARQATHNSFFSLYESVLLNESLECMIRWFTHVNSALDALRNESVFWRNDSKTNFRNISLVSPTGLKMSPAERVTDGTLSQSNSNCSIRYLQLVVNKQKIHFT